MSKVRILIVPIVIVLAITGLAIPKLLSQSSGDGGSERGGNRERTLSVRSYTVEEGEIADRIILNGTLRGAESVVLRPEISGRVISIHFEEGGLVEEGALLLKINDDELQAELASLEAEYELAEINFRRQEGLYNRGLVSQEVYDEISNRLKILEARKQLIAARVDKTEVRAPFSGRIGLRNVSPGQIVDANTDIAMLEQTDRLRVDFSIPERLLNSVEVGTPFSLSVVGVPEAFTGQIVAFNPGLDSVTRTIMVRGEIPNEEGKLRPGNFARVEIALRQFDQALLVPATALARGLNVAAVYVIREGKAQRVEVKVGIRTSDRVQVLEGLEVGDQVVNDVTQSLRDGTPVNVVETLSRESVAQR